MGLGGDIGQRFGVMMGLRGKTDKCEERKTLSKYNPVASADEYHRRKQSLGHMLGLHPTLLLSLNTG